MGVSLRESFKVGAYVLRHRLKGTERFPLVLMLEPLFRCNLACAGCGKIQYPEETLRKRLSPEECFGAAEECGAPVVSIAGGEPLIHPDIDTIATRQRMVTAISIATARLGPNHRSIQPAAMPPKTANTDSTMP